MYGTIHYAPEQKHTYHGIRVRLVKIRFLTLPTQYVPLICIFTLFFTYVQMVFCLTHCFQAHEHQL